MTFKAFFIGLEPTRSLVLRSANRYWTTLGSRPILYQNPIEATTPNIPDAKKTWPWTSNLWQAD
jgi:hypothetical protein